MKLFEYDEISQSQAQSGDSYLQFLNEGSLSLGLYVLPAGSTDTQTPHAEDEVYYVVSGRATVEVAGERRPVQPGSMIFVAKTSTIASSTSRKTSRCWSSSRRSISGRGIPGTTGPTRTLFHRCALTPRWRLVHLLNS